MSKLTKKTIEKLEAVKERILKNPNKFEMSTWFARSESCGTTCCIGGYGLVNEGYKFKVHKWRESWGIETTYKVFSPKNKELCDASSSEGVARKVLGITKKQAHVLFYEENWPEKYYNDFKTARWYGSSDMLAKVAAKRIDYFITTGE